MSIRTSEVAVAVNYAAERIGNDHNLVLVAFNSGDEFIIAPLDSDVPEGFRLAATIYWDNNDDNIIVRNVNTLE